MQIKLDKRPIFEDEEFQNSRIHPVYNVKLPRLSSILSSEFVILTTFFRKNENIGVQILPTVLFEKTGQYAKIPDSGVQEKSGVSYKLFLCCLIVLIAIFPLVRRTYKTARKHRNIGQGNVYILRYNSIILGGFPHPWIYQLYMVCNVHSSCVIVATLYSIELALNAYSQWFSNFLISQIHFRSRKIQFLRNLNRGILFSMENF